MSSQPSHERFKLLGLHQGRCAATEMHETRRDSHWQRFSNHLDLALDRSKIAIDRIAAPSHAGVASAIPAHRAAEGDVQIE